MPFTLSHPAAVVVLTRSGLPMVGLVTGAMVPDLPMFAPVPYSYQLAHSPLGIASVDLVSGVLAALVWTLLLRGVLLDASPGWLRERLSGAGDLSRRGWALLPPAVVVGSITHVVWDEFTHEGRWGARHMAWLSDTHLGYAGYHWAQAVSSVVGLAIVVVSAGRGITRRPRRPVTVRAPVLARGAMVVVLAIGAAAGGTGGVLTLDEGVHAAAISAAVNSVTAVSAAMLVAALLWRAAVAGTLRRRRGTSW